MEAKFTSPDRFADPPILHLGNKQVFTEVWKAA
jgi:hypothetical protein